ncbi:MAG: hypothetical protein IE917_17885 [Betaproteobacteria bacterium]|nr:hypothetical protein [Betaproteobacteria bacterium]
MIAMITITDGANSTPPGKEVMLSAEDAARLLKRGHVKSIVPEQSEEQPEAPATEGDQ